MILMSGYTMGFFLPRGAKHPRPETGGDVPAKPVGATTEKADMPPLAAAQERTEVPASYYFYRYF